MDAVMDDLRSVQESLCKDRSERDQAKHALSLECSKSASLEQQVVALRAQAAQLLAAVAAGHAVSEEKATAAQAYQQAVADLQDLQYKHMALQQEHLRTKAELSAQLATAHAATHESNAARAACQAELQGLRTSSAAQLEAARKAHAFEVTALHDKHASRLQLVEDFKNSVLADRHSAEEQWVKEREALQERVAQLQQQMAQQQQPVLGSSAAGPGAMAQGDAAMWHARLSSLQQELAITREERDAAKGQLQGQLLGQRSGPSPQQFSVGRGVASFMQPAGAVPTSNAYSAPRQQPQPSSSLHAQPSMGPAYAMPMQPHGMMQQGGMQVKGAGMGLTGAGTGVGVGVMGSAMQYNSSLRQAQYVQPGGWVGGVGAMPMAQGRQSGQNVVMQGPASAGANVSLHLSATHAHAAPAAKQGAGSGENPFDFYGM